MRREAVREGTWIVISQPDRVSDELGYSLRILVVSQQVRRQARGSGDSSSPLQKLRDLANSCPVP
jgi:hypothetical protein